jgi:threonine/homoserine/homoserine lactone efflux protein
MNEAIVSLISIGAMIGLAWATPGPNMFAVMQVSLNNGTLNGIVTGLGIAVGNILWATMAVIGMDQLFKTIPQFLVGLQILGCLYLIYLGVKSLQSARNKSSGDPLEGQPHSEKSPFLVGLAVIITNPKAILFFASIFTALVPPTAPFLWKGAAIALSGIIPAMGHTFTASVLSHPKVRAGYVAQQQKISLLFAIIFFAIAIQIAVKIF